jgi:lipopolysaccharide export LptBFGC system permease protein LptF
MGNGQLRARIDSMRSEGISPHTEVMHLQQMFSFPAACLVFAVVGVAVGLSTRRDGRLAALTLGLAVIVLYHALMGLTEAWTKGEALQVAPAFPAVWARWVPNIVLGLLGLAGLFWQVRASGRAMALPLPRRLLKSSAAEASPNAPEPAGPRRPAPRVVLRLPEISLPGPRLLDRYVTRRYMGVVSLATVGLLLLYYVGTFIDLAEKLFKGQADTPTFLAFLWHSTPQFIAWIAPFAALVAVLATVGGMARTGELMIMKASGVSLYRAALPLLLLALGWGALVFVLEDRVLGESNRLATALHDRIRGRTPHHIDISRHNWLVGDDGRIYYYALLEPAGRPNAGRPTLHSLSVFEPERQPFRLRTHTFANRAALDDGQWKVDSGWVQHFADDSWQLMRDSVLRPLVGSATHFSLRAWSCREPGLSTLSLTPLSSSVKSFEIWMFQIRLLWHWCSCAAVLFQAP